MPVHFRNVNPFNILALLIADLPKLDPELYQSKDLRDALSDTVDWDEEVFRLLTAFPEMNDADALLRDGMTQATWRQLQAWRGKNPGFLPALSLVCGLDGILYWHNILKSPYVAVGLRNGFNALNDNWEQTGILILPRVPSLNDPLDRAGTGPDSSDKTWAYAYEPGINEELANTYYVEKTQLTVNNKTYTAVHKVVGDWIVGNPILLAASPVAKGARLPEPSCYQSERGRRFSVTGPEDLEYTRRRVKSVYRKAAEKGANLLVYPEMLGEESMFDSAENTSSFFSQLQEEAADAGYSAPAVILPPTWWHNGHNQLHVIDGSGGYLCVQEKQNPFLYHSSRTGEAYMEDLIDTPPVIQVLHVPYIGRVTFPICKDYLIPPYRKLLTRFLRSTLMLCPSYSKGKFAFSISVPAELEYGCYTLWINTCSALPEEAAPPPYVGLIAAPGADLVCNFEPRCGGQCGSTDDPCLFLAEIRRTDGAPQITVREHICPAMKQLEKEETP